MNLAINNWKEVIFNAGMIIAGFGLGLIINFILSWILGHFGKEPQKRYLRSFRKNFGNPLKLLIPLVSVSIFVSFTNFSPQTMSVIRQAIKLLLIASVAWLIIKIAYVVEDLILFHFDIDKEDNLRARKIYTQIQFFKRLFIIVVGVIALGVILMNFKEVRKLGTTILASAGVIGIVLGFSAQRSIATIIAGLQIAITQPIRIDDVVIVENEWGRIEEITLTYVVVRVWDLRRLIVPITYFIEKPFQNWTRTSAQILGTVFIYVDYTVSVKRLREELLRLLKGSDLWDGKVWNLQITNLTEKTVELRALMSAENASDAWNLRCEIREGLLDFIYKFYPGSFPKVRAEINNGEIKS
jgi:small-conductance mechanosensitive channel